MWGWILVAIKRLAGIRRDVMWLPYDSTPVLAHKAPLKYSARWRQRSKQTVKQASSEASKQGSKRNVGTARPS